MVYELNPALEPVLTKYSCYLLSMFAWRDFQTGGNFTAQEVNAAFDLCLSKGFVDKDCVVLNPTAVFTLIGGTGVFRQVDGNTHFEPSYRPEATDYLIAEYHNTATGYSHFVTVNHELKIVYDSLDGKSITIRDGALKGLRVIDTTKEA